MTSDRVFWFSCRRIWSVYWSVGIGIGWPVAERIPCIVVQFGRRVLILGPHIASEGV